MLQIAARLYQHPAGPACYNLEKGAEMEKWTRKRIIETFTELVSKYSYEGVTVQHILEKAEVSKTTFYRYFRDKADVMDARFRVLYDEAVASHDCRSLQDLFTILLKQSREQADQYAMFATTGFNSYREFVYRYTMTMGQTIMETAWGRPVNEQEKFYISFFCAGGAKILQDWARGKQFADMSAEEVAGLMCRMIHPRYQVRLDDTMRDELLKRMKKRN